MIGVMVMGPESSGTRLVTELLIEAGCKGSTDAEPPWGKEPPPATQPIVWRRSFPHARRWTDLPQWAARMRDKGYDVRAVVMQREWTACIRSQLASEHVPTVRQAFRNLNEANWRIWGGVMHAKVPAYAVTYEALVLHPAETLAGLLLWLELDADPMDVAEKVWVTDENRKHYVGLVQEIGRGLARIHAEKEAEAES